MFVLRLSVPETSGAPESERVCSMCGDDPLISKYKVYRFDTVEFVLFPIMKTIAIFLY